MLLERSEEVAGLTLYKLLTKSWPIKTCFQQLFLKKSRDWTREATPKFKSCSLKCHPPSRSHSSWSNSTFSVLYIYVTRFKLLLKAHACCRRARRQKAAGSEVNVVLCEGGERRKFVLPLVKLIELELEWIFSSLAKDKRTKCLVSDLLCGPRIENTQEQ